MKLSKDKTLEMEDQWLPEIKGVGGGMTTKGGMTILRTMEIFGILIFVVTLIYMCITIHP